MKPADFIEEIFVREYVELVWDSWRLRRQKTGLLASTAYKGLVPILQTFWPSQDAEDMARKWAMREQPAIQKVDKILAAAGLNMDAVLAQALSIIIDTFERIDHMIMKNEACRNAILREIDRHRATLGQRLRQVVQRVEDAEFKVVEPEPRDDENAP